MMRLLFVFIVPVVLLLQGCPKGMVVSLYNNSQSYTVVQYSDGQAPWQRGTHLRLTDKELNRLEWTGQGVPALDVIVSGVRVRYVLVGIYSLPSEYVTSEPVTEIRLQLESDGRIYAVKAGRQMPVTFNEAQPAGFPIASTVAD